MPSPIAKTPSPQPHESDDVAYQAETTIEIGGSESDDPGYESESASSASTSLSSSVRDYTFEHGRRYHKYNEGRYLFPNDESEQEREDMKHAMILNLCGGRLHYSPLENPQSVLDIGTGTGIWAIDFGDEYPSATVLGVDLSPIQPSWVPPNVRFMVDNAESPWIYPPNNFDFIHIRHLASSLKDTPALMAQAMTHLKPGGWIEMQELYFVARSDDNSIPEDYAFAKWLEFVRQGLEVFGVELLAPVKTPERLKDAGFSNVTERVFKVPIGTWPKNETLATVGLYNQAMCTDGLQGNSMKTFTKGLGWTAEEVEVFLIAVRASLKDRSVHSYLTFHVCYGQKPVSGS